MKSLSLLESVSFMADLAINHKDQTKEEIERLRFAHDATIDELGVSKNVRVSAKKEIKAFLKTLKIKKIEPTQKTEWKKYRRNAWKITNTQPLHELPNIENRGYKNMHLDHKISIWYGFKNNIPFEVIGHISNLEMIPYKDNMLKGTKCKF